MMGLLELHLLVHAKHWKDGFPLCWGDETGTFEASWDDTEVTCPDCINYMKED
jgi:hypothetical protein